MDISSSRFKEKEPPKTEAAHDHSFNKMSGVPLLRFKKKKNFLCKFGKKISAQQRAPPPPFLIILLKQKSDRAEDLNFGCKKPA